MTIEQDVYTAFIHGPMPYLDAISALVADGYQPDEAKRVVDEWIDGQPREDKDAP